MQWLHNTIDTLHKKDIIRIRPVHWKARLFISLILLVCSILGVLITDFAPSLAWHYWLLMVPFFAILCIWLGWYVARKHHISGVTIWHEVLHWFGLLIAVYIVSIVVHSGIISYLTGALFVLILLSLTVFLAGVHFDAMFMLIGFLLALLAAGSVYFIKYLTIILIPLAIVIGAFLIWRYIGKKTT